VDYFEHRNVPFAVAVNAFDGEVEHDLEEVRWALDIAEHVPLIVFDARKTGSVRDALLAVLEVAVSRAEAAAMP
jgi:signal recognition particle receptor subunit beta